MLRIKLLLLIGMCFFQSAYGQKVGLVLSGGGARGFAHIGTLKMLDSLEIPVDFIMSTSMGALAGAMYAAGYSGKYIETAALDLDWEMLFSDQMNRDQLPFFEKNDFGKYQVEVSLDGFIPVPPDAFVSGQKAILVLNEFLPQYTTHSIFKDMPIPFQCNAVDLITGQEVQLKEGILPKAMRASIAIPTVFSPVSWGDSLLVDGGVRNNLATDIAKNLGMDIIIAVNAGTPRRSKNELANVRDIFEQTIGIIEYDKEDENEKLADLLIKPNLGKLKQTDYSKPKIRKIIKAGNTAAHKMIPELLKIKQQLKARNYKKPGQTSGLKNLFISEIEINGNLQIPDKFIEQFLGIQPDKAITIKKLNKRISELYGLGYFKLIDYEFTKDFSKLIVHIQEKSMNKFRMGARWDNEHQIVIAFNVQTTNKFISGMRLENQFQFGGLRKNEFSISFPSRQLNTPVYPYFSIEDSWTPITIYRANGKKHDQYDQYLFSLNLGAGAVLGNIWSTTLEYSFVNSSFVSVFEKSNFEKSEYENEKSGIIKFSTTVDNIDNNLMPRSGLYYDINAELTKQPGSAFDFFNVTSLFDFYKPIRKHSFRINFTGNFTEGSRIPFTKYLFSQDESYHAGFQRWEIFGDYFLTGRAEFIYQHKKDIFAHFYYNPVVYARYQPENHEVFHTSAGGIGITLLSAIGNLKFNWSIAPNGLYESNGFRNGFYLSAGYLF